MAVERSAAVELFWRVHRSLYRWTGGRIGGSLRGLPVLLLTTTGRKTGRPRTTALSYLPHGDDFVVIASYLGEPRHPAWFTNLEARPEASVQVGPTHHSVHAREAHGEERDRLWNAMVAKMADYAEYQARTTRRIPVVVLERTARGARG
jgi:deazaflavin-dependent oxidoreductase (nitroreductase family)